MKKRRVFWVLGILLVAGVAGGGRAVPDEPAGRDDLFRGRVRGLSRRRRSIEHRFYLTRRPGSASPRRSSSIPNFAMAMLALAEMSDAGPGRHLVRPARRPREGPAQPIASGITSTSPSPTSTESRQGAPGRPRAPREVPGRRRSGSRQLVARGAARRATATRRSRRYEELIAIDPNNCRGLQPDRLLLRLPRRVRQGDRQPGEATASSPATTRIPSTRSAENQAYSGHYNEAIENLNRALAIKPDFFAGVSAPRRRATKGSAITPRRSKRTRRRPRSGRQRDGHSREIPRRRPCGRR